MAPQPELQPSQWITWWACALVALAILAAGVHRARPTDAGPLVAVWHGCEACLVLGAGAVLAAVVARVPRGARWLGWGALAGSAGIAGVSALVRGAGTLRGAATAPALHIALACVGGMLLIDGVRRVLSTHVLSAAVGGQLVLDVALVLGCILAVALGTPLTLSGGAATAVSVPYALFLDVGALVGATVLLALADRPPGRAVALCLALAAAWLIGEIWYALVAPPAGIGLLSAPRWAILALGAALDGRGNIVAGASAPPESLTNGWPWAGVPRLCVAGTTLALALVGDRAALPAGLLASGMAIREATLQAYLRGRWRAERARWARLLLGVRAERDGVQATVDDLARLAHDQAAPITALWAALERVPSDDRGRDWQALALHLEHLHTLAGRQHARLRGQASGAPRRTRVDVAPIRDAVIAAFAVQALRAGIALDSHPGTKQTEVAGDPVAIRRILDNLVSNALRATPRGGHVLVELWDDHALPAGLTISVRDSGGGIPPAKQPGLFQRQGDRGDGPGLGLGLAIIRELAEAMGGTYGVESTPGRGSHIWVRLPREDAPPGGASKPAQDRST